MTAVLLWNRLKMKFWHEILSLLKKWFNEWMTDKKMTNKWYKKMTKIWSTNRSSNVKRIRILNYGMLFRFFSKEHILRNCQNLFLRLFRILIFISSPIREIFWNSETYTHDKYVSVYRIVHGCRNFSVDLESR